MIHALGSAARGEQRDLDSLRGALELAFRDRMREMPRQPETAGHRPGYGFARQSRIFFVHDRHLRCKEARTVTESSWAFSCFTDQVDRQTSPQSPRPKDACKRPRATTEEGAPWPEGKLVAPTKWQFKSTLQVRRSYHVNE